jgi:hypothetical protein
VATDVLHAADAMRVAATVARNDEILEVTVFLYELLAERVEHSR